MADFREKEIFARKILPSLPQAIFKKGVYYRLKITHRANSVTLSYSTSRDTNLASVTVSGHNLPKAAAELLDAVVKSYLPSTFEESVKH